MIRCDASSKAQRRIASAKIGVLFPSPMTGGALY